MKFLLLLISLYSTTSQAAEITELNEGVGFTAGLTSIGSELGYVVGISTPHSKEGNSAHFLWGTMLVSGIKPGNSNFQELSYNFIELSDLHRLFQLEKWKGYFKSGILIIPPSDLSNLISGALRFGVSTEYFVHSNFLSIYTDVGVNFPISAKALNLEGQPTFGRGALVTLGVRAYFY